MATKRLYRSRNGELMGVCQGIADWRDYPVKVIRLIFILCAVFTAVFPCLAVYFLIGLVLPANPYENNGGNGKTYYYTPDPEDFVKTETKASAHTFSEEEERRRRENDWDSRFSKN